FRSRMNLRVSEEGASASAAETSCAPKRRTVRNAPKYAENGAERSAAWGGLAEVNSPGRDGACRPSGTRPERRSVEPVGVRERSRLRARSCSRWHRVTSRLHHQLKNCSHHD